MEKHPSRSLSQPLIGVATLSVALIALTASWAHGMGAWQTDLESPTRLLLALCSVAAITLAYRFPIYVRHSTKICVCTVPLYLITVFLDPSLGATVAGLGVLAGELVVRRGREAPGQRPAHRFQADRDERGRSHERGEFCTAVLHNVSLVRRRRLRRRQEMCPFQSNESFP